ncbi:MAG TPA: hypothetical protein DCQ79_12410, partial [Rhizobiales bacterium]|nr:hypothetical protein [Hyphomicrobiales bacterium]
ALNGLPQHLGLCECTRVVSSGLGSPWVSFSTHFAFLSGTNILGSIAGSPQALSQNFQLFIRSLLYSRRSRCVHNFQLSGAKKPCFQLCLVAHGILLIAAERRNDPHHAGYNFRCLAGQTLRTPDHSSS